MHAQDSLHPRKALPVYLLNYSYDLSECTWHVSKSSFVTVNLLVRCLVLLTFNRSQVTFESENKLELCCAFSERRISVLRRGKWFGRAG